MSWGFERKGKKVKVCHGAALIAVTAAGTKKLEGVVSDERAFGKAHHFDVLL